MNINRQLAMPRRTFLRGLGAGIALPLLDAMVPVRALGAAPVRKGPLRLAFVYVPNGANMVPSSKPMKPSQCRPSSS